MRSLALVTTVFISLSGCSDVRTDSTDVAHVDYVNRVFYVAHQSAIKAGCYELDEANADKESCINKEVDATIQAVGKSQFNRSMKIINQLEEEGKIAKADDGISWYFLRDRESI